MAILAFLCVAALAVESATDVTFTCDDVKYQSCSRVCSDKMYYGLDMEYGACQDECEEQTTDCETFRMPNPFGAKKGETYGVPAVAAPAVNVVQVNSTLFYSVCALLVVLVTANVT